MAAQLGEREIQEMSIQNFLQRVSGVYFDRESAREREREWDQKR